MTYDCRSILKHILKCNNIFSDVHHNRKKAQARRKRQKLYCVNQPLDGSPKVTNYATLLSTF